ncbi:MAG TPA: Xaa-Pro peptidase family protein [Terriglobales bacterium]|nr:Xaa-Pro peptidase family protein [Terriglobales bacterium]
MSIPSRLQRLQHALAQHRLDALLVSHPPNLRYLCGFSGSSGVLAVTEDKAVLFTDGRYTAQARQEVSDHAGIVITRNAPFIAVAAWVSGKSAGLGRGPVRIGIEGEHLSVASARKLKDALPGRFRLRPKPPLIEQARMIKDGQEIARIRAAAELGASLFPVALGAIRPGVCEAEVAATMEFEARRGGAEGMSFETIVAAGARSALPHGRASQAPIPADGFVVCDFGVILSSYCSDRTRTVYVGSPGKKARQAYAAVLAAQEAAVAAVRPGVKAGEVDRAARTILEKSGLSRYFTHSTGHGVGLEIHEAPRIAKAQEEVLQPGMVITIEPGVYIPEQWGLRIEDMVVVTQQGCEVLAPSDRQLIII